MVSKASIKNAIDLAYENNSLEFLCVCDGGKQGQAVYVQAYAQNWYSNPQGARSRVYVFYGYDRYKVGEIDGQEVWDSKDEESWREVFYSKASAVEFAREIGVESLDNNRLVRGKIWEI